MLLTCQISPTVRCKAVACVLVLQGVMNVRLQLVGCCQHFSDVVDLPNAKLSVVYARLVRSKAVSFFDWHVSHSLVFFTGKLKTLASSGQLSQSTESLSSNGSNYQPGSLPKSSLVPLHADAKPFQPTGSIPLAVSRHAPDAFSTAVSSHTSASSSGRSSSSSSASGFSTHFEPVAMQCQMSSASSQAGSLQHHNPMSMASQTAATASPRHNMTLRSSSPRPVAGSRSHLMATASASSVTTTTVSRTIVQQHDCSLRRPSLPISCSAAMADAVDSRRPQSEEDYRRASVDTSDYGSCSDGTPTSYEDLSQYSCFLFYDKENYTTGTGAKSLATFARTPGAGRKKHIKRLSRTNSLLSPRQNLLPEGKLLGWSPVDGGEFYGLFCVNPYPIILGHSNVSRYAKKWGGGGYTNTGTCFSLPVWSRAATTDDFYNLVAL